MSVIEFIGTARAGKTTIARALEKSYPGVIYYPERHDLIPKKLKDDVFEYNLWYAKYCIEQLQQALGKPGLHLFERGVIDHIIIGEAHFKMGWFKKRQLDQYLSLLMPLVDKNDLTFVFKIPVDVSLERAEAMGKDVTRAVPYMKTLSYLYGQIHKLVPDAVFLPENISLIDMEKLVVEKMKLLNL
ncbi:MAG: hypothetical protein C4584_01235 [Armatimonadetes bacterium]|nr:MAG: hypothetical protein C4584_01235 [Armatimonadota bacterium]